LFVGGVSREEVMSREVTTARGKKVFSFTVEVKQYGDDEWRDSLLFVVSYAAYRVQTDGSTVF
jgi:hypothetical protein